MGGISLGTKYYHTIDTNSIKHRIKKTISNGNTIFTRHDIFYKMRAILNQMRAQLSTVVTNIHDVSDYVAGGSCSHMIQYGDTLKKTNKNIKIKIITKNVKKKYKNLFWTKMYQKLCYGLKLVTSSCNQLELCIKKNVLGKYKNKYLLFITNVRIATKMTNTQYSESFHDNEGDENDTMANNSFWNQFTILHNIMSYITWLNDQLDYDMAANKYDQFGNITTASTITSCPGRHVVGSWANQANIPTNIIPQVNINRIPVLCGEKYCIKGDNNLWLKYEHPKRLRRVPHRICALRRYIGITPKHWPIPSYATCAWPLFIYYKLLLAMGQSCIAMELHHICRRIVNMWHTFTGIMKKHRTEKQRKTIFVGYDDGTEINYRSYFDDFCRHVLKNISSNAYILTFSVGPAYSLLCHLHALTAKSPYTMEQIRSDIDNWTSDRLDGVEKQLNMDYYTRGLDSVFREWLPPERDALTFRSYLTDVVRWGTSGGGPASEIRGEKHKTKWAWGLGCLLNDDGSMRDEEFLFHEFAKHENDDAIVALKEEPQKTREIISTPITSYVRQAYLLYKWGKPRLPSPISSASWLPMFERSGPSWYGCIDGERFDQTIPADAMIMIIDKLGGLDSHTREVADLEIEHLKGLHISWGKDRWKWRGGLLSGWRMTSLFGSIISYIAAQYILDMSGHAASCKIGVMGDDVVLYSNSAQIEPDVLVDLYQAFGLRGNLFKTTVGENGEFLRKVRSACGSMGFPALGLRSIMYASPWITSYQYNDREECANNWLTTLSRLIPHTIDTPNLVSMIYQLCASDLCFRFGSHDWSDWLLTPISAGGGGCIEIMGADWAVADIIRDSTSMSSTDSLTMLGTIVGIFKSITRHRYTRPLILSYHQVELMSKNIQMDLDEQPIAVKHDVNITKLILSISLGHYNIGYVNSCLVSPLPHNVRRLNRWKMISIIMGQSRREQGMTTILNTKESCTRLTRLFGTAFNKLMMSRGVSPKEYRSISTASLLQLFSNMTTTYGTW